LYVGVFEAVSFGAVEVFFEEFAFEGDLRQTGGYDKDGGKEFARIVNAFGIHSAKNGEEEDALGGRGGEGVEYAAAFGF
jgi:hypothetical protein